MQKISAYFSFVIYNTRNRNIKESGEREQGGRKRKKEIDVRRAEIDKGWRTLTS